jgi:hypothetical protein
MPGPFARPVMLTDEERTQLESLVRAHSTPQALAFRCQLILRIAAPEHPPNRRVAAEMRCDRHTVGLWRSRSLEQGLTGLQEAPRSGRPRRFSPRCTGRCSVYRSQYPSSLPLPSHAVEPRRYRDRAPPPPVWQGDEPLDDLADTGRRRPETASERVLAQ